MKDEFDELKDHWKSAKKDHNPASDLSALIEAATLKRKSSQRFHYGNVVVLTIVLMVVAFFFLYLFGFQELLSKVGVALMLGGLAVRILLEIASARRFNAIVLTETTSHATNQMVRFYKLRRLIHGPITITIVTVYVVGLLMLTPEFLIHIGPIIYLFNGLFMASGIVIIWFIRKSIRKETLELEEIIAIKRQIES